MCWHPQTVLHDHAEWHEDTGEWHVVGAVPLQTYDAHILTCYSTTHCMHTLIVQYVLSVL